MKDKKDYQENTIIIAQQQIQMPVSCPECNKWFRATITDIKTTCPFCNKKIEKDLASENENTYGLEVLKTVSFILLKEFQTKKTVTVQAKDRYLPNMHQLVSLFKPFGITLKDSDITTMKDERTGKKMTINRFVLEKDEKLEYYFGKKEE